MKGNLQPRGIREIFGSMLVLYGQRFSTFGAISAVVSVPYALLMAALGPWIRAFTPAAPTLPGGYDTSFWTRIDVPSLQDPGISGSLSASGAVSVSGAVSRAAPAIDAFGLSPLALLAAAMVALLGAVLFLGVVYPLCQAALIVNVSAHYLGEDLSAADSFARVFRRIGALMSAQVQVTLWVVLGVVCCILPGVIAALWFMVVPAVVLLEDPPEGALRRSRSLMAGNLWRGFLLGLVATLASFGIESAGGWVIGLVPWPSPFLRDLLENLVQVVTLPLEIGVTVLFYYDLRIRKEALDLGHLETQMRALER